MWYKKDRRPGGPQSRCGSFIGKKISCLCQESNLRSTGCACWAVPERQRKKHGLWTPSGGQVGATLGSDCRGCTVGSFVRGPFFYLTDVAFDLLSRAWAAGWMDYVNPLNAKLNPICHLLALLGAHHILHVSRIRVNSISGPTGSDERSVLCSNTAWMLMCTELNICSSLFCPDAETQVASYLNTFLFIVHCLCLLQYWRLCFSAFLVTKRVKHIEEF